MKVIALPAVDKVVSLAQYVQAIKTAKANPEAQFKHGLTCWWSCSGAEIMRQFQEGMTERINQAVPYNQRG